MSQSWPLSQKANKSSGVCSVCHQTRQLHLGNGHVHRHGPRDRPCPGSDKLPLAVNNSPSSVPEIVDAAAECSETASVSQLTQSTNSQSGFTWTPINFSLVRRIPQAARVSCTSHLASILREVVAHPDDPAFWHTLFNWGGLILSPPKRGGKRHNLATVINNRISSFCPTDLPTSAFSNASDRRNITDSSLLAQAVAAKLEEGNLKAAVRIIASNETPALPSIPCYRLSKSSNRLTPHSWVRRCFPAQLLIVRGRRDVLSYLALSAILI